MQVLRRSIVGRGAPGDRLGRSQVRCIAADDHWFTYEDDSAPVSRILLPHRTPRERARAQEGLEGGVLYRLSSFLLVIWTGDISKWHIPGQRDAIVAPANKKLNIGIGVNRMIHNAAGPSLADACVLQKDVDHTGVKCQITKTVVTKAYRLPIHKIIHAVGPVFDCAEDSSGLLATTYRNCLRRAEQHELECIAFPPISCGVYGYPVSEGARIALREMESPPSCINEIHFVLNDPDDYITWISEANAVFDQKQVYFEITSQD